MKNVRGHIVFTESFPAYAGRPLLERSQLLLPVLKFHRQQGPRQIKVVKAVEDHPPREAQHDEFGADVLEIFLADGPDARADSVWKEARIFPGKLPQRVVEVVSYVRPKRKEVRGLG